VRGEVAPVLANVVSLRNGSRQQVGARHSQGVFNGVAHGLVHLTAVAKTHLNLGRMHVHVHARWVNLHIQGIDWLAVSMQHVFVSAAGRVGHHFVAHIAAVDVGKLVVATRTCGIGHASATDHGHVARAVVHGDRVV
jgi:hypothetical protein